MYVDRISEIDTFSGEADVVVSDGKYKLLCYAYLQGDIQVGMVIKSIEALFVTGIEKSSTTEHLVKKEQFYYAYELQGKVVDIVKPTVSIGKIFVDLDTPLPKDILKNDYIRFKAERFACY